MGHTPWHDSHLRINGTDGDYFGYWAFEAGAVAYLYKIDDSQIDHMVYPKDLVAFARSFKDETSSDEVRAQQPCPRSGYWSSPAEPNSRRYFNKGDILPSFPHAVASTVWCWDEDQGNPQA